MTETKTFKNPHEISSQSYSKLGHNTRVVTEVDDELFASQEWDIEVTFTRKPKPIAVGDKVYTLNDPNDIGTVIAVYEENAWVKWSEHPYSSPGTWGLYELKHVKV